MVRLIVLLIGYAFGLFQTSYIYGRLHGIDIRKTGSGNAGTTNALRTLGKKAGIIVMIGDIVKCILAVVVVYFLFGRKQPEIDYLLRRNVKKPGGAKPGFVVYYTNYSILARADISGLREVSE